MQYKPQPSLHIVVLRVGPVAYTIINIIIKPARVISSAVLTGAGIHVHVHVRSCRGSRGKLAGKSVFLQIIDNDNAYIYMSFLHTIPIDNSYILAKKQAS